MYNTFFEKVADYLFKAYPSNLSNICLVLPNRRAGLFLKTAIAKKLKKTLWSPEIIATEDFIAKVSGLQLLDNTTLLFKFYEIYKGVEGENAQSFEEFMSWAQILLSDYNEIDSYNIDTKRLFNYINENRALEVWNISGEALTDVQKNYLKFWSSIGLFYDELTKDLIKEKQAYQGLAFKIVANDTLKLFKNYELAYQKWEKVIFIGFNALNDCEEKIIQILVNEKIAEVIWDSDLYYLENEIQEAGRFLRKHKNKTGLFNLINPINQPENLLSLQQKNIEIIGVASNIGQAKVAGEILSKLDPNKNFQNSALVLSDENLLSPVINSIPPIIDRFNITMGYPLKNDSLHDLIMGIFQIHDNAYSLSKVSGKFRFYFKDLFNLFSNQYFIALSKSSLFISQLEKFILKKNRVFLSPEELKEFGNWDLTVFAEYEEIFSDWKNNTTQAIEILIRFVDKIAKAIIDTGFKEKSYEMEFVFNYQITLKQLSGFLSTYHAVNDLRTLKTILNQLINSKSLAFYGEPLTGLQIMGVLETRNLDFETVILLSANEGILPGGKNTNSFIPYEVKKNFKLPTHTEKDSIFAYHFYRLIQRARNIYLLYNTETDEFGSGEKSRFLTQLIHELPKTNPSITISEKIFSLSALKGAQVKTSIPKSSDVLQTLNDLFIRGISPSALSTYIQCPLDFYYKYVLGLREEEEIEETIDAATMGSIIHEVLELLYIDYIGKIVKTDDLKKMKSKADNLTELAFLNKYSKQELFYGKNRLIFNVSCRYIQHFLDAEINYIREIENEGKFLTIIALEIELKHRINIEIGNTPKQINIKGKVDRIDKIGDVFRIIDYKTGNTNHNDVTIKSIENISLPEKSKAMQLLTYAFLFKNQDTSKKNIRSGIYSLRNPNEGLIQFSRDKDAEITPELLTDFSEKLTELVKDIFNPSIQFTHRKEAEYCKFC